MTESPEQLPSRRFSGTLQLNEHSVATSFTAGIDATCRLKLCLDELPMSSETLFIRADDDGNGTPHFVLTGAAEDGTQFASESAYFTRFGRKWDDAQGTRFDLDATCAKATFTEQLVSPLPLPKLTFYVRGFASSEVLIVQSPYGRVAMNGSDGSGDIDLPSGVLLLEGTTVLDDVAACRAKAKKLLDHVRRVMSFASGTDLSVPVTKFELHSTRTIEVERCLPQHRGDMPVFHWIDRQGAFEAAVTSFSNPKVEHLWMAIEWLTMNATHNESRLLNVMTALENLINSNVPEGQRLIIGEAMFRQLRRQLRDQIRAFVAKSDQGEEAPDITAELEEKLSDLQRRSLRRNLTTFVDAWSIPMQGLDPDRIGAAITARNAVVHRGVYYREGADQIDLWSHMTIIRELVTRAVLTAIGFRGH